MIVKILRKSKTFRAVRYNTNKVEKEKGELLKVSGFKGLSGLSELKPQDYINYLSSISALNQRVVYPQFHAVISAKGKSRDKESLSAIAESWLSGMGYGAQPYLLIFHRDTDNNHIHIISSRVDWEGKKISDVYEKIRAYRVLNQLIGKDERKLASEAVESALKYRFSTSAQFLMILEAKGYSVQNTGLSFQISKFGEQVAEIDRSRVEDNFAGKNFSAQRKLQLKMIFEKYRTRVDAHLVSVFEKLPGGNDGKILGYSSLLSKKLCTDFGLEFIFHFKNDRVPYGYTVLDHAGKNVFKGSEIIMLSKFVDLNTTGSHVSDLPLMNNVPLESEHFPKRSMLLEIDYKQASHLESDSFNEDLPIGDFSLGFDIADDIDDEQINGRNRRKQRKARTNTR
ncbi:relaxase/mobilization nuclease domain-containing protein [Pedobacter aquatilis]|uniref:relaxase/mobilization nuclease domain-containing protein n=1 Tax=Pedobacter aquatilis TaxID=351343 RepID=UPI0029319F47|nr:relaxase/mobilization nuclease domain-containing protein [Pedobacter aquatilis]